MALLQMLQNLFARSTVNAAVLVEPRASDDGRVSRTVEAQGVCPVCGAVQQATVYDVLDASETPQAYEALLSNAFNVIQCRAGHTWSLVRPLLLHLPRQKNLLFYTPNNLSEAQQNDIADEMMEHFLGSVPAKLAYMNDLAIVEGDAADNYLPLIAVVAQLEGRPQHDPRSIESKGSTAQHDGRR